MRNWFKAVARNRPRASEPMDPGIYEIVIGDRLYAVTSGDDYPKVYHQAFEPEMVRLYQAVAARSKTILDIGANIGLTTLLFAELAESVHAFEPSAMSYDHMVANLERARCDNVAPHRFGLGDADFETTLTYAPSNRSGGFVSNLTQVGAGHEVESISIRTLDGVVHEHEITSIDFIKIDVEGFESHVLRGGQETLKAHRPRVVMELNHWTLNAFQRTSVPDFFDFLTSVFPVLFAIDGSSYLDLHDQDQRYRVMHDHIVHWRYPNLLGAFGPEGLAGFHKDFSTAV